MSTPPPARLRRSSLFLLLRRPDRLAFQAFGFTALRQDPLLGAETGHKQPSNWLKLAQTH